MKKEGPSEEAMRNFYEAVKPALIRIAKKEKEADKNNNKN